MYSAIAKHILYPVGEIFLGTRMLKYLKILEETQWWSPAQLRELQNEKLRTLIKHAYENVPYYHCIFQERGLTPRDIETVEDLQKLPILTKNDIRQNLSDLIAKDSNKRKPFLNSTSGSTGEPLQYYATMDCFAIGWASTFRSWAWAGYRLGDKRVTFGGASLVPTNISFKFRLRYFMERNLPLTSFGMTDKVMEKYAQRIARFKPRYIRGYPSAISTFARYIAERGINDIRPQAIFTTAETLLPGQREIMESVFKCEVFDQYGLNDGGAMIMECPTHEGYHVMSEKAVVEIIKDGKKTAPGEQGEIITTDLHNYAMPFIRYATGDLATPTDASCSCGRGLPLVKSIEGRIINSIRLKDGTLLSGVPFQDVFESIELERAGAVRQYQVIQEDINQVVIKIVKGPNYVSEDTNRIMHESKNHTGGEMEIKIEFADDIPTTAAGKRLFTISKVLTQV